MEEFFDEELQEPEDVDLYPEYNDVEPPEYITPVVVQDKVSPDVDIVELVETYMSGKVSDLMAKKIREGDALFQAEGLRSGLCDICFGYSYNLTLNDDGFPAAMGEVMPSDNGESAGSIRLTICRHGVYEENVSDFAF